MSISDQRKLAENLRLYLLEFADLPVTAKEFSLDGLLAKGTSMSLQITGGTVIRQYINGSKKVLMPFTIFYRNPVNTSNEQKSIMMGTLNGVGEWLDDQEEMPYFGNSFVVTRLEQVQQANIANQTEKEVVYQAGFALEYETKK